MGSKKVKSKSEEKRIKTLKGVNEIFDLSEVNAIAASVPLTAIQYRNLPGDKVIITGFYGFLSLKEIGEQCGKDILNVYEENNYRTELQYDHDGEERLRLYDDIDDTFTDVFVGEVFDKDDFSEIIAFVKKCGKYLHDLKIAIRSEEKTIGI